MGWQGPMTGRQFDAWSEWLNQQWNEPNRTDHYLMQLTAELRRVNSTKNSKPVNMNDYKVTFIFKNAAARNPNGLTKEQMVQVSKQIWIGRMTAPVREVKITP